MVKLANVVLVLTVIVTALFGSLVMLGAMSMETFTDSIGRVIGVGAIVVAATTIISFINSR